MTFLFIDLILLITKSLVKLLVETLKRKQG